MKTPLISLLAVLVFIIGCSEKQAIEKIQQWSVYELILEGPAEGNPYMDVVIEAEFSSEADTLIVPGFYDGDGIYIIRLSPDKPGSWKYRISSSTEELDGIEGMLDCIPAEGENHGPLKVVNTYYLQYADGTPYYGIGTTAYQWTSVDQHIQEQTLQTLAEAPFNKIRMCVFPKNYRYGNDTEPWRLPFAVVEGENDYSQPDFEFFRNVDKRVKQLMEMGIQADVILFHPYDIWNFSHMGDEWNERYVRYMIARLGAYRNVWWSLANEWDVPEFKERINWEGIGNLLLEEDPYQRLRGIHNWYDTEDHFYDHSRPWITHTSTQTSRFFQAIEWREKWEQPLLFDEMRYEGDVESNWGNMTSEEMASYFWMAGLSGGYPTHGDTYVNDADTLTEVRWWGKGGKLVGTSPKRIAFFRSIMEEAPVEEMSPAFEDHDEPWNRNNNIHVFSKDGEYYLIYVAGEKQDVEITLPGDFEYTVEIIDTWNMDIDEQEGSVGGSFSFTTEFPYTAIRIKKK